MGMGMRGRDTGRDTDMGREGTMGTSSDDGDLRRRTRHIVMGCFSGRGFWFGGGGGGLVGSW